MNIGSQSSLSFDGNNWILKMDNGDSKLCTKQRLSKVSELEN